MLFCLRRTAGLSVPWWGRRAVEWNNGVSRTDARDRGKPKRRRKTRAVMPSEGVQEELRISSYARTQKL